jgi:RND family efflux transporter MFP subunit
VLFEIDSRSFQNELARAEADLSLKEARLKLTQTNFDRASALAKTPGAVSREELDRATGDRDAAMASLQTSRVTRDGARIALEGTKIIAPVEGRIGGGLLNVGNLVKADDTTLGTIVSVKPIHVQFDVDERTYLRLSRAMKAGKQKLAVSIGLVDEAGFPREATIDFIDNRVIEKTNTIRFRALLRDADDLLLSGMSCRVRMTMAEPYRAMLIPERAIRDVDGAKVLYVVNENNKVELRRVEIGLRQADGLRVVRNGLKAGEKIVLGGFDRLQTGTIVNATLVQEPPSGSESKQP